MRIEMMIEGSESIPEIYIDGTRLNVVKFAKFYGASETMFSFDANYPQKENLGSSPFPLTGLSFGLAIDMVKKGHKIQRAGWNGKRMFVYYVPDGRYPARTDPAKSIADPDGNVSYGAYLAIKTVSGEVIPWLASQADMLADDWRIIQ